MNMASGRYIAIVNDSHYVFNWAPADNTQVQLINYCG